MVPKRLTYHIWIAKFATHCIGLQVFGDSADDTAQCCAVTRRMCTGRIRVCCWTPGSRRLRVSGERMTSALTWAFPSSHRNSFPFADMHVNGVIAPLSLTHFLNSGAKRNLSCMYPSPPADLHL